MNKLFLKLIVFIIFCVSSLFCVGCDIFNDNGKEFNLKNSTSEKVLIKKIGITQDFEIEPKKTATVFIDSRAEAFDLEVVWKGETYVGMTNYIDQTYRKITIELMDDMNCKITIHQIYYDDDISFVQLGKQEE